MNKKDFIIEAIFFIAIIILAFLIGRCTRNGDGNSNTIVKSDTTFIHHIDTIFLPTEKIVERTKTISIKDTIYLPKDTVILIENKLYSDSISNIYFSGYKAQIDSIKYFLPSDTVYINTEKIIKEKQKKWSISVHTGVGLQYGIINNNKQFDVGPYVGIGVSYNIFSW